MMVNRIKELRAQKGWTQADLAEKAGISREAVISIEKYKYTPSLELAFQFAEIFELPVSEIFERKKELP